MENPKIRADVIEATEFPELVQRYRVSGVPKTVINDKVQFEGAVTEEVMLEYLSRALNEPLVEEESDQSRL
mgnify:FL=1